MVRASPDYMVRPDLRRDVFADLSMNHRVSVSGYTSATLKCTRKLLEGVDSAVQSCMAKVSKYGNPYPHTVQFWGDISMSRVARCSFSLWFVLSYCLFVFPETISCVLSAVDSLCVRQRP